MPVAGTTIPPDATKKSTIEVWERNGLFYLVMNNGTTGTAAPELPHWKMQRMVEDNLRAMRPHGE